MNARLRPTPLIVPLGRNAARLLSIVAYAALIVGFALDVALQPGRGPVGPTLAIVKLVGLIGCLLLFLTRDSYQANAPETDIDERERAERNAVYLPAFATLTGAIFVSFVVVTATRWIGAWQASADAVLDLLSLLGIGGLALPGTLLAWRRRADDVDELDDVEDSRSRRA